MKRRILSIITALALCLGLLPGTALAEDQLPSLLIQDTMVTAENMADVLGNGTVSTAFENGKWTIRLTNATLSGPISVNHTSDDTTVDADIILSGDNTVTVNRDYASGISASANLTIIGEGSLAVTSNGANAAGIGVSERLVISGAKVSATAQSTAIYGDTVKIQESQVTALSSTGLGLLGTKGLEISDSTVSANSTDSLAAASYGNIVISDSEVSVSSAASMGINTSADIEISGQSVITGTNFSYSLCTMGSVFISGGKVDMTSTDEIAIYAAKQLSITEGADVTAKGSPGGLVVGKIGTVTGGGALLVDGAALHTTGSAGPGVMVDGEAVIQGSADVTAISKEHGGPSYPGYGLLAQALTVDGSKVSASSGAKDGIYIGTRETPAGGDMTVKGDSEVTAAGKDSGITVEGTLSVEGGRVSSQSQIDHGIEVGDTLLILKGSVDSTSEEYRGVNIGKLLDIRNGAEFHAKGGSYMDSKEDAVMVKNTNGIKLGNLCVEKSGGVPGAAKITSGGTSIDVTVFVNEDGNQLQEVTITTDSADYTGVNAAISRIPEDLSVYTTESVAALNSAKNAVNWELPSAQQETVDGYAAAIEAAIAGLIRRPVDPGQIKTEVRVEEGISQVPEGLKNIPELSTPAGLEAAMRTAITQTGVPSGNTAVYDVTLMVSTDGGRTWTPAARENFPSGGLTVTLPYPAGTNSSYTFTVVHMFTTSDFGKTPGDTETPTVTNTADGLRFTVTGLSPISVGWVQPSTPTGPTGGGGGGGDAYAVTVERAEHGKVTSNRTNASSGSTVTLTVTPDTGYVLDTLTVTNGRGSEIRLTAQGGGKYTFTMPSRAVTVKATFAPLPDDTEKPCDGGANCPSHGFTDLGTVGTWYHEAVDYVLRNNLMGGYGNGLFGPNDTLTRAQFAQILYNKEGRPAVTGGGIFTDVAPGAWCAPAIIWTAERGIVGGYGNGRFGPNDNITREQLAVMLWRYAGSPAATDKELHFNDADKASGYALDALRWAVENGIMSGKGGGILDPKGLATRGQTAQMLKNFLEK